MNPPDLDAGFDAGIRDQERLEGDMTASPIGPRVQRFATAASPACLRAHGRPAHRACFTWEFGRALPDRWRAFSATWLCYPTRPGSAASAPPAVSGPRRA